MDCSPPGSSVHEDSPGKNTGVACHFLLQGMDLRHLGTEPMSLMYPALADGFFITSATWETHTTLTRTQTKTSMTLLISPSKLIQRLTKETSFLPSEFLPYSQICTYFLKKMFSNIWIHCQLPHKKGNLGTLVFILQVKNPSLSSWLSRLVLSSQSAFSVILKA